MGIYIETSSESVFKYGEELCGDKVETIRHPDAVTMVLADGLGSGVKANILSTLTSKIVATMLSEGASVQEAVETIASTLPVCSERGIAYSTFSILKVSSNGQAHLVEFDNPEAVILRRGKPIEVEKTTEEIGGKRIKESRFQMQPEDMCVMFSDGAVHAGVGRMLNFGWQRDNIIEYITRSYKRDITARSMTKLLLSACDSLYMQKPGDDTTVMAAKVRVAVPATVMVGPPVDKSRDVEMVNRFISAPGKKIACGGTTSQIISKVTGRELSVKLDYVDPSIPPIAQIPGVDLVTEGVVTLGRALEHIRNYCSNFNDMPSLMTLNQQDGASQLAKMLLEECTEVRFLVGRALNPAHQNPDLPLDLSLKLRMVQDIAKLLGDQGKNVEIEFC
ncbi:MAG: SpoIIE family protein phosphatase [Christensenellales bacterium]